MRRTSVTVVLAFITLLFVSDGSAQQTPTTAVPSLIRYGGTLKDASGTPIAATTGVTFAIYKQQDGGAPMWIETQTVTPDASGNYSVLLGNTAATGLPRDLFSQDEQRWLGVQVQGEAEQPRVLLVSVPYAFKAHEAETLAGKSISDFVLAKDLNPNQATANVGSAEVASSASNGLHKAKSRTPTAVASEGPTNFSGSTTDQIVGVAQSGSGVGVNVTARANAVVGTSAGPNSIAIYGIATNSNAIGVKGISYYPFGTGVRGTNSAGSGVTTGISAYVGSPAGTAAVFNNAAGGKIISGQNNGMERFSVDGSGNVNSASGAYRIGGSNVLSIGSAADGNLFLGLGAGTYDIALLGARNTFSGYKAGHFNTEGDFNTFSGYQTGYSNTEGYFNTFSGYQAGYSNTTAPFNTFNGSWAGYSNTTGPGNTFIGDSAGYSNTIGEGNIFVGSVAGWANTTGKYNTFSGANAGSSNVSGSYNTFSGDQAGYANSSGNGNTYSGTYAGLHNTTGNNNIYMGNVGCTYPCEESSTIRIGGDVLLGYGAQTAVYIAGIYGSTSSGGVPVYINSDGLLGTQTSSLRFKESVHDMGDSTHDLMKLRPVTFLYKPEYDRERTLQYGLIAEEVAKVYPELVAYDKDGQPYTVKYQYLAPMLLNELQKQHAVVAAQQDVIQTQQEQIDEMRERLSRLEALIGQQIEKRVRP